MGMQCPTCGGNVAKSHHSHMQAHDRQRIEGNPEYQKHLQHSIHHKIIVPVEDKRTVLTAEERAEMQKERNS